MATKSDKKVKERPLPNTLNKPSDKKVKNRPHKTDVKRDISDEKQEHKKQDELCIQQTQWPLPPNEILTLCGGMSIYTQKKSSKKWTADPPVDIEAFLQDWKEYGKGAIVMVLDHSQFKNYQLIQQAISEKIPHEPDRPTIKLVLRNCNKAHAPLFTVGLIGGVGPLADAEVLSRMVGMINSRHLKDKQFDVFKSRYQIKLLSAPPPRTLKTKFKMVTQKIIGATNNYACHIEEFLKDATINTYEMTSNTGHSNIGKLNMLQHNPFTKGPRQLVNVVENTVQLIANIPRFDMSIHKDGLRVLIVGTADAWDAKLYQNAFANVDISFVDIGADYYKVKGSKLAFKVIEEAIESIKEAKAGGKETLLEIIKMIAVNDLQNPNNAKQKPINVVAFTCSEVSLAVKASDINKLKYLDQSKVVDTTQLMALNMVIELEKQYEVFRQVFPPDQMTLDAVQQYINEYDMYDEYGASISYPMYADSVYNQNRYNLAHSGQIVIILMAISILLFTYFVLCFCGIGIGYIGSKLMRFSKTNRRQSAIYSDDSQV